MSCAGGGPNTPATDSGGRELCPLLGCPSTPCNRRKLHNHPDKSESASEAVDDGSASGLNDWKSVHRRIKKQRRYEPLPACKCGLTRHQDTPPTQSSDELLGVWVLIRGEDSLASNSEMVLPGSRTLLEKVNAQKRLKGCTQAPSRIGITIYDLGKYPP